MSVPGSRGSPSAPSKRRLMRIVRVLAAVGKDDELPRVCVWQDLEKLLRENLAHLREARAEPADRRWPAPTLVVSGTSRADGWHGNGCRERLRCLLFVF